jgi:hypothetical protein
MADSRLKSLLLEHGASLLYRNVGERDFRHAHW